VARMDGALELVIGRPSSWQEAVRRAETDNRRMLIKTLTAGG
jgi:hypothetical protein